MIGSAGGMNRLVVTDAPGVPLVVSAYADDGQMVPVQLEPLRALRLAAQLVDAAESRLRGEREAAEGMDTSKRP